MTSLLLKSNALTATMAALCWLCSNSLGLMLLWALVLAPAYLVVMAWWLLCCELFEEQAVPKEYGTGYTAARLRAMDAGYQPIKLIGATESPRALQPRTSDNIE